ncbi:MAG: nucleotidyltransferase domain-containing protein [Nitrospirae bacterium]|nr:nucleotidyltransferase domain-containing protein [Nitrospirota bacterium]
MESDSVSVQPVKGSNVFKREFERKLKEVVNKIIVEFLPEKIILFGSYAWGSPNIDSDVDLFVIKETENTRVTSRYISRTLFPLPFPIALIVYTPAQVEKKRNHSFFLDDVLTKGKILFDRQRK